MMSLRADLPELRMYELRGTGLSRTPVNADSRGVAKKQALGKVLVRGYFKGSCPQLSNVYLSDS